MVTTKPHCNLRDQVYTFRDSGRESSTHITHTNTHPHAPFHTALAIKAWRWRAPQSNAHSCSALHGSLTLCVSMLSFGDMSLLQRLVPKFPKCADAGASMVIFPSSMKTIPFTVPSPLSTSTSSRRLIQDGDSTSVASTASDLGSTGYPSMLGPAGSPSMLGSMDSLGSTTSSEFCRGEFIIIYF